MHQSGPRQTCAAITKAPDLTAAGQLSVNLAQCVPPVLSCGHLSLCPDLTVGIHKHVTLGDQSYQMTDPDISFINPEIV